MMCLWLALFYRVSLKEGSLDLLVAGKEKHRQPVIELTLGSA